MGNAAIREQDDRAGWNGITREPPQRAAQIFASFYLANAITIVIDGLLIASNGDLAEGRPVPEEISDNGGSNVA